MVKRKPPSKGVYVRPCLPSFGSEEIAMTKVIFMGVGRLGSVLRVAFTQQQVFADTSVILTTNSRGGEH